MSRLPAIIVIFFICIIGSWASTAQDHHPIILTVRLEAGMEYLDNSSVFRDFEVIHPNVKLNVVYKQFQIEDYISRPSSDLETYLDGIDKLTLQADVLILSVGEGLNVLTPEATRAGYILDLKPLFSASSTSNAADYYPTVWQAAQWDGGLWILPTSTVINAVIYDADAFDSVNLAYPKTSWGAVDFANAADRLVSRDSDGEVTNPGFFGNNWSDGALASRFLDQPLYDPTQLPMQPDFVRPDTIALANQWLPSLARGTMFNIEYDYAENFSPLSPLGVDRITIATLNDLEFVALPGDDGLVNINGFVVSSRTQYPELAYELAAYLAGDGRVAGATSFSWGGITLARPQYPEADSIEHTPISMGIMPEEGRRMIELALNNGIPASELLFYPYFKKALELAAIHQTDIEIALEDAEMLAMHNLERAEARRDHIEGSIATPIPEIALDPEDIQLRFFLQEGDIGQWRAFAIEFAQDEPEIVRVVMDDFPYRFDYRDGRTDCFYMNSSFAQTGSEYLLDIAPLLAADSEFFVEDWLPGVFDAVQVGESIYALPLAIRPMALWYDPEQLERQSLQPPTSANELIDLLNALNVEDPVLASYRLDRTLLMLMASFGALPIDQTTTPPQIDFTSDNTLATIQQVLDLARSGIIKYGSITEFPSSASFPDSEPLLNDLFMNSDFRSDDYLPVTFPAGSNYTPVTYDLMAGYISRFTPYPEACYRLLRSLSQHSDLLNGLPAHRSEGMPPDNTPFYSEFERALRASNLVIIPDRNSEKDYYLSYWLLRAFDRYVLEDADLFNELYIAEQFTNEYLLCIDGDRSPRDCAMQVDSTVTDAG